MSHTPELFNTCVAALRCVAELADGQLPEQVFRTVDQALEMVDAESEPRWNRAPGSSVDANARLIAAAPDLLAVARMVLQWDGWGATDSPMAAAARAAIAKAEGQS